MTNATQPARAGTIILEEAENLSGDRIATVQTKRGEEYLMNVDAAVCALAALISDLDNEHRQGWTLNAGWYAEEFDRLRRATLTPGGGRE